MKLIFLFFVFFLISATASAEEIQKDGYSAIGYNGDYFIIGTFSGDLIKYDGEKFILLSNLGGSITKVVWSGDYWLIGGDSFLIKYNEKFLNLSDYKIYEISCSKSECLVCASVNETLKLLMYNGKNLNEISKNLSRKAGRCEIKSNDEYWLFLLNGELYKYDGKELEKLPIKGRIFAFEWNGSAWLISVKDKIEAKLLLYDGRSFYNLRSSQELFESPTGKISPVEIAWNGKYWLMDNRYAIIKFDGIKFEKLLYNKNVYSPYRVKKIVWNGDYWLILYDLAGTEGSALAKYDGNDMEWLSYPPLAISKSQWTPIGDICWGKNYWLIGTYVFLHEELTQPPQYRSAILKYDGADFMELKPKLSNASAKPEQREKFKNVSAEDIRHVKVPESRGEAICGPTFVLLLPLLTLIIVDAGILSRLLSGAKL